MHFYLPFVIPYLFQNKYKASLSKKQDTVDVSPLYLLHDTCHHPHNLLIISNIGLSEDATKTSTTVDTMIALQNYKILSAWQCYCRPVYILLSLPLEKESRKKKDSDMSLMCLISWQEVYRLPAHEQFYYNPLTQLNRKTISKNVNKSEDRDQTKRCQFRELVKKGNHDDDISIHSSTLDSKFNLRLPISCSFYY